MDDTHSKGMHAEHEDNYGEAVTFKERGHHGLHFNKTAFCVLLGCTASGKSKLKEDDRRDEDLIWMMHILRECMQPMKIIMENL